jgi:hypothetical protein
MSDNEVQAGHSEQAEERSKVARAVRDLESAGELAVLDGVVQGQRATDDALHDVNQLFKEIHVAAKAPASGALDDLEQVSVRRSSLLLTSSSKELSRAPMDAKLREVWIDCLVKRGLKPDYGQLHESKTHDRSKP